MTTILLVGVLGALLSAVIGTLWYSGSTPMGKWHMQCLGFDALSKVEQEKLIAAAKPHMWKTYLGQLVLSFVTSFFIAFVTDYTVQNGGPANAVFYYVVMIWAAFTVPMIGQQLLWGTTKDGLAWKRFFSDGLCNLITFLVIAYVATLLVPMHLFA